MPTPLIARIGLCLSLLLAGALSISAMAASPCSESKPFLLIPGNISCSHQSTWVASSDISTRKVIYQLPAGTPPAGGWPAS